jgi:hypothetical protein
VTAAPRQSAGHERPDREQPDVPVWALVVGALLVLIFTGLVLQTFSGRSLVTLLATLVPSAHSEMLTDADHARAFYVPGATVQVGQLGIGSRGQDRAFQPGDLVLLGTIGRLVRLEDGNRLTEIQAVEGSSLLVTSLGGWDPATGSLAGLTARYVNGAWIVAAPQLEPVGAALHVKGAPEEELSAGFRLMPATAGRVRRLDGPDGPVVRIRPTGRTQSLALESWDPLPGLDNVSVTVQATVRASEGASLELALNDVVDAAGTVQKTAERRSVLNDDEWLTLRIRRRVLFASPDDRFSVGLLEVRNRDWLEVRELGVYLGVQP